MYIFYKYTFSQEVATRSVLSKQVFLKNLEKLIEKTWAGLSTFCPVTLKKMRLHHRCLPVKFEKFLRTSIFI